MEDKMQLAKVGMKWKWQENYQKEEVIKSAKSIKIISTFLEVKT
jgi:hypothetical protein